MSNVCSEIGIWELDATYLQPQTRLPAGSCGFLRPVGYIWVLNAYDKLQSSREPSGGLRRRRPDVRPSRSPSRLGRVRVLPDPTGYMQKCEVHVGTERVRELI